MRRQAGWIRIVPVCKIHDLLHDVESLGIEKEGVIAEQSIQLRSRRMVVGNHLGFELAQSSFDQSGIQLHRTLLSLFAPRQRQFVSGRIAACDPSTYS